MRQEVIQKILEKKIIAIVRGIDEQQALCVARALRDGGIHLVEVTFNQMAPETFVNTANAIRMINEELGNEMYVGAGTVTTPELVRLAAEAGANYIISPDTDIEVIRTTREQGLVSLPGAYTPSEAKQAHLAGADFVKLFPCVGDAVTYLKALCAPLNHIRFMAVGGITAQNAASFLQAGAVGVGVGGSLVNKNWINAGEYYKITEEARRFVDAVK